jgi:hypothetical protein
VARSRNSSPYFLGAAITLILHGLRASIRPGAIQYDTGFCYSSYVAGQSCPSSSASTDKALI